MNIAIITDSSAGVSITTATKEGIYVARMPMSVDGKEYLEELEISRKDVIDAMRNGSTLHTSQPLVGQLMTLFDELLEKYDHCIFFPISSKLSGTYQTALAIAADYEGRVTVVDTKFVSAPLYYQALEAKKMVDMGMSPLEIKTKIEKEAWTYAALIPEDIVYLKRGGRISSAAAAVANLLKIIPVLKVYSGGIDLADKVRTYKKAVKTGVELTLQDLDLSEYEVIVLNGDCDEKIYRSTIKDIESKYNCKVIEDQLYPIVLAHTGPGSIAIAVRKKLI